MAANLSSKILEELMTLDLSHLLNLSSNQTKRQRGLEIVVGTIFSKNPKENMPVFLNTRFMRLICPFLPLF